MKTIKISELPVTDNLQGLKTIGVDAEETSVAVSLEFIKTETDEAVSACKIAELGCQAAGTYAGEKANEADAARIECVKAAATATSAGTRAILEANSAQEAAGHAMDAKRAADNAATAANEAATNANQAAENANQSLAFFIPQLEAWYSYGVEWDVTNSSPALTRIGNTDLHRILPIQTRMKGFGFVNDKAQEAQRLATPQDWEAASQLMHDDGSIADVMVEIPKHYRKFEVDGNKRRVLVSEVPLVGYEEVPQRFIGAYEATIDRTNNKLKSVASTDARYRGGDNTTAWDNTYRSLLGCPSTGLPLNSWRTLARWQRDNRYNALTYGTQKALYWLYCIEYANFHMQLPYEPRLTGLGYKQGGLGAGVTKVPSTRDWQSFNNRNPFIKCGTTNEFGNDTGVKSVTIKNSSGGTFVTCGVPRYRGIENPFGHTMKILDGCSVTPSGALTGSLFNYSNNPNDYERGENFLPIGQMIANGFGKKHFFGQKGEIFCDETGAAYNTYTCAENVINPQAANSCTLFVGGSASSGNSGNMATMGALNPNQETALYMATRLVFLPELKD